MPEEPTESPPLPTASVTDVANFISNRGFKELAQLLVDDEVDGEALYLLSVADFLDYGLKKGPAMKLHNLLQQRKPSGAQDALVRVEVPASPKPSSMQGMAAEDEVDECRGRQVDRASAAAKASRKPGRLRSYAAKETAQVLFNADATEAQQVDGDSVVPKRSQKSGRVRSAPAKEAACAQEDEEMEEEKEEESAPPPPKPAGKSSAAKASAKSSAAAKSSAKGSAASSSEPPKKAAEAKEKAEPQGEQKIINKDSLKDLELKLQQHVDTLGKMVVPKLQNATAKKAPGKFINELLQGLQLKLSLAECESIQKTSQEMVKQRKKQEQEKAKRKQEVEDAKKKKELGAENEVKDEDFFADFM
mmetsp:Transcript_104617/g.190986  ORF Transcript_104617/g.190986 Transcript_104617/m.190986 type:complete len:361 (-) Transcript_104617:126-1208(-)